jgi:hypothetical protein
MELVLMELVPMELALLVLVILELLDMPVTIFGKPKLSFIADQNYC